MKFVQGISALAVGVCLAGCNMWPCGNSTAIPLPQPPLAGTWGAENTPDDVNAELTFLPEGRLAGCSGINRIMGSFESDPANATVKFGPMGMTMMAGPAPAMEYEQKFLMDLNTVTHYKITNDDLYLYNGDQLILSFDKEVQD